MQCGKFLDKITVAGGDDVAVLAVLRAHARASRAVAHGNRLAQGLGLRFGAVEFLCKRVGELVGGEFEIRCLTPGEVMPRAQSSMR